jgi:hypothetical protein
MIRLKLKIFLILITLFSFSYGRIEPPANIQIIFSEKTLDIYWDSVPGTIGYNIYTSPMPGVEKSQKKKINSKLITSGPHFTYIWNFENGKRVRRIKGYEHHISLTSVFSNGTGEIESPLSREVNNCYFKGFRNINTLQKIEGILAPRQNTPYLPVKKRVNKKKKFLRFMKGPGKMLHRLYKKHIDPLAVGGCAPVSTVLVKLLDKWGLNAYRVEGTFIKEYHTFAIINIDKVEYVLDFTADQFLPDVSPVMVPRDYCNLNRDGKLSLLGRPVYQVGKIFSPDQINLSNSKKADVYKTMYNEVLSTKK